MANTGQLSRLMHISWDIQRGKKRTRSKSLQQAWAIFGNEDITVQYLTKKLNHQKPVKPKAVGQYAIDRSILKKRYKYLKIRCLRIVERKIYRIQKII